MIEFLRYCSKKYYEGNPVISDDEFDHLAEIHGFTDVGHSVQDGVAHLHRMYSLQKVYIGEGKIPFVGDVIETPKLDGAAVSLLFFKGKLIRLLTRGDGKRGQDISHLIPGLPIPTDMSDWPTHYQDFIQIDGEIVAPKNVPNARNYASGALGLDSVEEVSNRDLCFFAYAVHPSVYYTYETDMCALDHIGIPTIIGADKHGLLEAYPTDGLVVRLNDNKKYEQMGYTSHHPRGAYALKERKAGLVTTLKDVIWQVGRTGAITPVAILEPVNIDGAVVSRATLHNIKEIRNKNLEIGCKVEVARMGEIIPGVVRRVD